MTRTRIRLDCTSTAGSGINTGIQRVVRNVVASSMSLSQALGIDATPVVFDGRAFHAVAPRFSSGAGAATGRGLRSQLRAAILAGRRHRILRDTLLHDAALGTMRRLAGDARWQWRGARASLRGETGVAWRTGDWLVLLDSNWQADLRPALRRARASGARVCVVIYDLIHVRHPEYVSAGAATLYRRWFVRTLPLADRVVAISRTVLADVQAFLDECGIGTAGKSFGWFHLGAELDHPGAPTAPQPALASFLAAAQAPLFMAVGTLEPRKDQVALLDAVERLWTANVDIRLLLIGRMGWGSDALVARLATHPERGRRLLWLADASDADLEAGYGAARAVVVASRAEGFGLPIVEALRAGCAVVASALPVFIEVGGTAVRYFPPGDVPALAEALADLARAPVASPARPKAPPTWDDATRALLAPLAGQ
jgi:glycosyltransferase involved in cell wall biosynthesis